jgi:anaerobic ribonucleoside-triphosphate reductase activating protein
MGFDGTTRLGGEVLNVANRVRWTEAEGPGARYALWVQGCPLRCPGCCNPHMLEDREESLVGWEEVADDILSSPGIEGVTFIGGEPFWQAGALAKVAERVREAGLSVMVFTGQTIERLRRAGREDYDAFLGQIDLLIDGPFVEKLLVNDRRWIGSSNQRVHFLTDRYVGMKDERGAWDAGANTIELRMVGNEVTINGFPDADIVALSAASIRVKKAAGE